MTYCLLDRQFSAEVFDDASAQLSANQAVDDGIKSRWNNNEQDAQELLDVGRGGGESVGQDDDSGRYLKEHVHHQVCGTRLEGLAPNREVASSVFDGAVQDFYVGESNDDKDPGADAPAHGQTWKNTNTCLLSDLGLTPTFTSDPSPP